MMVHDGAKMTMEDMEARSNKKHHMADIDRYSIRVHRSIDRWIGRWMEDGQIDRAVAPVVLVFIFNSLYAVVMSSSRPSSSYSG